MICYAGTCSVQGYGLQASTVANVWFDGKYNGQGYGLQESTVANECYSLQASTVIKGMVAEKYKG
ncbi:hypothetical protein DPMN_053559 [Dreissena polymorpha]|uniref:Uncharacterized protein n=1 Tax=Dreissena polymorpha TaxID=45954 RepID=A0A9D4CLK8_DREPO|nr:hypothetical protein DPMN_053559 [Dreissena polymorpha]